MTSIAGLNSEMGWGTADESESASDWGLPQTAVLVLATGLYWSSVWLLAGLPPLAQLARLTLRPRLTLPESLQERPA